MGLINRMLTDFFTKGFYTEILSYNFASEFDSYNFLDCNKVEDLNIDTATQNRLDEIHQMLADNYVSQIYPEFRLMNNGMWHGVDEGSAVYHNDVEDGDAFNSNILVYIDDNTVYNNCIMITDGVDEHVVQPVPNQMVWLNQSPGFKHKAVHNSGPRRLLSFEFFINGLNN